MSDDNTPEIGLVEGYERATFLRRGGTATLYSARRSADGEPVVIKVFDADQTPAAERHLRTQERLAGIGGALTDLDHGVLSDGRSYVVLPYIHGGSLSDHITRFGSMPPNDVAAFGAALAATLHEAHAAGVLHRDLKPSNVLLADDGRPLLCDFGAATTIELTTASETMALTVLYAAPEVLEGAPADELSDQYSLGLTLQAAASGSHPFGGTDVAGYSCRAAPQALPGAQYGMKAVGRCHRPHRR